MVHCYLVFSTESGKRFKCVRNNQMDPESHRPEAGRVFLYHAVGRASLLFCTHGHFSSAAIFLSPPPTPGWSGAFPEATVTSHQPQGQLWQAESCLGTSETSDLVIDSHR